MFRVRRNVLSSLKFHTKRFARHFSTPTLPEFADVVIIGENESAKSVRKEREIFTELFPPAKIHSKGKEKLLFSRRLEEEITEQLEIPLYLSAYETETATCKVMKTFLLRLEAIEEEAFLSFPILKSKFLVFSSLSPRSDCLFTTTTADDALLFVIKM
jgi:hypothetical protein